MRIFAATPSKQVGDSENKAADPTNCEANDEPAGNGHWLAFHFASLLLGSPMQS
jgi:hypothetical protein